MHYNARSFALGIIVFVLFGSYYWYDNPSELEKRIKNKFSISTTQYKLLYSSYSLPNMITPVCGGVMIRQDRKALGSCNLQCHNNTSPNHLCARRMDRMLRPFGFWSRNTWPRQRVPTNGSGRLCRILVQRLRNIICHGRKSSNIGCKLSWWMARPTCG